jgi:hypothetical protein
MEYVRHNCTGYKASTEIKQIFKILEYFECFWYNKSL